MARNEAREILMKRDGYTKEEAMKVMADAVTEIENGNWDALFELGLEDDYIFDFI